MYIVHICIYTYNQYIRIYVFCFSKLIVPYFKHSNYKIISFRKIKLNGRTYAGYFEPVFFLFPT